MKELDKVIERLIREAEHHDETCVSLNPFVYVKTTNEERQIAIWLMDYKRMLLKKDRKIGYWKPIYATHSNPDVTLICVKCSECGAYGVDTPYCPTCGCQMESEVKDEPKR